MLGKSAVYGIVFDQQDIQRAGFFAQASTQPVPPALLRDETPTTQRTASSSSTP